MKEEKIINDNMGEKKEQTMELPKEVLEVMDTLKANGFEAFAVGGCVRDMLRGVEPKDWDVTTNAKPEEMRKLFKRTFVSNTLDKNAEKKGVKAPEKYGTITVLTDSDVPNLKKIEITTYRKDGDYSDQRHPDDVQFTTSLTEDLARRDFTVNAMAYDGEKLIDLYGGQKDLEAKVIRAVGDPRERFREDALRIMRAVRFSADLGFDIEGETYEAVKEKADSIRRVSWERIRDEFLKTINARRAGAGIRIAKDAKLLEHIVPELLEGDGMDQNHHHIYTVLEHNIRALEYAAEADFPEDVRLAALFHDLGKARTKEGEGKNATFLKHEIESTNMAYEILKRLKMPRTQIAHITKLVRYHMFNYDPDITTDRAVRKVIHNVGAENFLDLIKVRQSDRIGSGCEKPDPYRLRYMLYWADAVMKRSLFHMKLAIDGNDIKTILSIPEGRTIGHIMNILRNDVIENPELNTRELLEQKIKELNALPGEQLELFGMEAKKNIETVEDEEDAALKEKHRVR
jgi:poly(A) polymerase/tRNA nucleotidyltransferase (CCA-adding enzyme)